MIAIALRFVLAPAAVAATVAWVALRWGRGGAARHAIAWSVSLGFCAGYALLGEQAAWNAELFWQWTPYLALAVGGCSAAFTAAGVRHWERRLLTAALAIPAAWLLTPNYDDMSPGRPALIAYVAFGVWTAAWALEALARRAPLAEIWVASGTMLACAIVSVVTYSQSFANLGISSAAALAGAGLAAWLAFRGRNQPDQDREQAIGEHEQAIPGSAPVQAILLLASFFPSAVDPMPQKWSLALLALAPLGALGAAALIRGPQRSRLRSITAVVVAAVIAAAVTAYLIRDYGELIEDEW